MSLWFVMMSKHLRLDDLMSDIRSDNLAIIEVFMRIISRKVHVKLSIICQFPDDCVNCC